MHLFTRFLHKHGIRHDLIKVATPRHNGKVERSHRTDNQCFYAHHKFKNLAHARHEMEDWLYRYNNVRPMSVLWYQTPQRMEDKMLEKLRAEHGKVTYLDLERPKARGLKPYKVERQAVIAFFPKNEKWALADRPIKYT